MTITISHADPPPPKRPNEEDSPSRGYPRVPPPEDEKI
jgi:hypothetical protein